MCEWVIARLDKLVGRDVGEILVCQDTLCFRRFSGVFLKSLLSIRLEIIGGKIPIVEQVVKINSQWLKAMHYFGLMMSERESKLKGPWI